jgi:hypothetical protein
MQLFIRSFFVAFSPYLFTHSHPFLGSSSSSCGDDDTTLGTKAPSCDLLRSRNL